MNSIEIGFVIYFSILIILWIWKVEMRFEKGSVLNILHRFFATSNLKISKSDHIRAINTDHSYYHILTNRKKIIQEIIKWGFKNISYQSIDKLKKLDVNLDIRYYKHQKKWGCFSSLQNKITIYVYNMKSIERIVYVVLHELVHKYQFQSDPRNFNGKYNILLAQKNYDNHPMEIEANTISLNQLQNCIQFLLDKQYIKK